MNTSDSKKSHDRPTMRPTARSLPIALLRARESVMLPVREMLHQSGITEQQWRILRVVEEAREIEQTAIAKAACLQLPSLTRILKSMETEGLIARKTDEIDRRRSLVSITDMGRSLIAANLPRNNEIFKRLEAEFGEEKLEKLLDLLGELLDVKL